MKAFLALALLWAVTLGPACGADGADVVVLHTVQPGETLSIIAERCGCSVRALQDANPDLGAVDPQPGSSLRLPPSDRWVRHTVCRGDTLFAISRRYGATVDEIRQASRLEGTDLEVGMALCVPRVAEPAALPITTPPPPPSAGTSLASPPTPSSNGALPRWVEIRLPDGRRAWAPTDQMIVASASPAPPERVVALARQFIGTPYRWGGESPNGADCSGFVEEVFRLAGHRLPRTADVQFQASQPLEAGAMQPGDLVFFSTYLPGPSHVGIYAGSGVFIHASSSRGVTESHLDESYYARRYLGARRISDWPIPPPAASQGAASSSTAPNVSDENAPAPDPASDSVPTVPAPDTNRPAQPALPEP